MDARPTKIVIHALSLDDLIFTQRSELIPEVIREDRLDSSSYEIAISYMPSRAANSGIV